MVHPKDYGLGRIPLSTPVPLERANPKGLSNLGSLRSNRVSSTYQQRCQYFKMGVEGHLIWGDDDESEVFAQAQNHDLCLIFRYSLN